MTSPLGNNLSIFVYTDFCLSATYRQVFPTYPFCTCNAYSETSYHPFFHSNLHRKHTFSAAELQALLSRNC